MDCLFKVRSDSMDFLKMLKPQLYGSLSNIIDLVLSKSLKGIIRQPNKCNPPRCPYPNQTPKHQSRIDKFIWSLSAKYISLGILMRLHIIMLPHICQGVFLLLLFSFKTSPALINALTCVGPTSASVHWSFGLAGGKRGWYAQDLRWYLPAR